MTVRAHRGTARSGTRWLWPALAALTTGPAPDIAGRIPDAREQALDNTLGWVTAGRPKPDSTVTPDLVAWPGVDYPLAKWGTLAWNSLICPARVSGRVPLTAPGLVKRTVGPFDVGFKCNGASARVFVRMRATLASRVKPKRYRQFRGITAPLSKAEIAVRTESGEATCVCRGARLRQVPTPDGQELYTELMTGLPPWRSPRVASSPSCPSGS